MIGVCLSANLNSININTNYKLMRAYNIIIHTYTHSLIMNVR